MSGVRVLAGTRKGAFVLTSDGKRDRWEVSGPHFAGWEIYHVKGSPADPDRLYASQSSGWSGQVVQRSDDGGTTWVPVGNQFAYQGTPGTHQWYDGTPHPWEFARVWHLEPSLDDPDMVYAGVEDAGLFRSDDGGQSWQELPKLRGHESGPSWQPGGRNVPWRPATRCCAGPSAVTTAAPGVPSSGSSPASGTCPMTRPTPRCPVLSPPGPSPISSSAPWQGDRAPPSQAASARNHRADRSAGTTAGDLADDERHRARPASGVTGRSRAGPAARNRPPARLAEGGMGRVFPGPVSRPAGARSRSRWCTRTTRTTRSSAAGSPARWPPPARSAASTPPRWWARTPARTRRGWPPMGKLRQHLRVSGARGGFPGRFPSRRSHLSRPVLTTGGAGTAGTNRAGRPPAAVQSSVRRCRRRRRRAPVAVTSQPPGRARWCRLSGCP